MKKLILTTMAVGALGLTQAFGLQVTMGTYVSGAGGNYTANPSTDFEYVLSNYSPLAKEGTTLANTVFGTFCLEKVEYFSPGSTYNVTLNSRAMNGGADTSESPDLPGDPISLGTAFLYQKFATGSLGGAFDYSSGSALALQNMIWYLEDEQASYGSGLVTTYLVGLLNGQSFGFAGAKASNAVGGYGVQVMNLTDASGGRHQDQLVYTGVPDGGTTLALLGLGLAGLATIRRRFLA